MMNGESGESQESSLSSNRLVCQERAVLSTKEFGERISIAERTFSGNHRTDRSGVEGVKPTKSDERDGSRRGATGCTKCGNVLLSRARIFGSPPRWEDSVGEGQEISTIEEKGNDPD